MKRHKRRTRAGRPARGGGARDRVRVRRREHRHAVEGRRRQRRGLRLHHHRRQLGPERYEPSVHRQGDVQPRCCGNRGEGARQEERRLLLRLGLVLGDHGHHVRLRLRCVDRADGRGNGARGRFSLLGGPDAGREGNLPPGRSLDPRCLAAWSAALVGAAVTVAAVVALWWFLAPPQVGGRTAWAVVEGTSMEPRLGAGDLVLVRARSSYDVDDVVLFESETLAGAHVLHRIVGTTQVASSPAATTAPRTTRIWLAGDAVTGRLWLTIPAVGSVLQWLGRPLPIAVVLFALVFTLLAGGRELSRQRPRRCGAVRSSGAGLRVVPGLGLRVTRPCSRVAARSRCGRRRSLRRPRSAVVVAPSHRARHRGRRVRAHGRRSPTTPRCDEAPSTPLGGSRRGRRSFAGSQTACASRSTTASRRPSEHPCAGASASKPSSPTARAGAGRCCSRLRSRSRERGPTSKDCSTSAGWSARSRECAR